MMKVACVGCGQPYPKSGVPYKCPNCGGLFDDLEPLTYDPHHLESRFDSVSLGEGRTPLISAKAFGRDVLFKCEYLNPSGSFKDRGTASLIAFLLGRGVTEAIEDSSGNAGASFAAYAARAGIKARIYIPESASGPKRRQIEMYSAELVSVSGPRSATTEAVLQAADRGLTYASHAYLPFNLPGYATCAYEIAEQLGRAPGAVIVPAGQGGFLLGLGRGFEAMQIAGTMDHMPAMIGVQASACAPLYALWKDGTMNGVEEAQTAAEGVRTHRPLRAKAVVEIVRASGGRFVSVEEAFILPGRDALARLGFYVEPTSALVWHALEQTLSELPDPAVVVLTGSGLKS